MLSNIANDLDLLLSDLCHLYPLPSNQKPCLIYPEYSGNRHNLSPYDEPYTNMRNFISGSKHSLQSLSTSEPTSTADSGHDVATPGSVSPDMPLYHVEQVVKKSEMRSNSNSPSSNDHGDHEHRPISLLERLSKTHSIWLLPEIARSGAVHLLKDRPTGTFVVRRSSQPGSLALSVQHQLENGSSVDHYIIENIEQGVRLQGSNLYFQSVPHLIDYYLRNREELPTQLVLPPVIMNAKSSKELSSLALLGPDFWQSTVSRHNSSEHLVPGTPVLHKSCSEPINITRPLMAASLADVPGRSCVPSHSLCDFSKFIIDKKHARIDEEAPPVPPKLEGICEDFSFETESCPKCVEHCVGARAMHTSFVGSELSSHRHHLYGYKDMKSKTHPGASCKAKSSHYVATSLDVVNIPDQGYFRSSLEDKMSDYEDVWKNSICESDNVSATIKCNNIGTQTHDPFMYYSPRYNSDVSPTQNESGISTLSSTGGSLPSHCMLKSVPLIIPKSMESEFRNVSKVAGYAVKSTSDQQSFRKVSNAVGYGVTNTSDAMSSRFRNVSNSVGYGVTITSDPMASDFRNLSNSVGYGVTTLSDPTLSDSRNLSNVVGYGTTSTSDQRILLKQEQKSVVHLDSMSKSSLYQYDQQLSRMASSTSYNRSTEVEIKESPNSKSAPKSKPPPLPTLSRIKSNSTSSLSTIAPSPIYAEPVDAVDLNISQPVSIRIRRKSAPSCDFNDNVKAQATIVSHKERRRWQQCHKQSVVQINKVSQQPQLETILSPRNDTFTDSSSFVFSFGSEHYEKVKVEETKVSKRAIGRSQSMRSSDDMSGRKVTRQRSLKEKFARLKWDMLKIRGSSDFNHKSSEQTVSEDLFSVEDIKQHSGTVESPLHKFPVYKKMLQENRASCFSDSSTVQDLISCAHPEFNVKPIQPSTVRNVKCVSEYDNLCGVFGHSSVMGSTSGTVFCNPWDNSPLDKLLHSQNGVLQPAMNSEERVQRWQMCSQICESSKVSVMSSRATTRDSVAENSLASRNNLRDSVGQESAVHSMDSFINGALETSSVHVTRSKVTALSAKRRVTRSFHGVDTLESAHVNVALDDTQGGIILDPSDEDVSVIISSDLKERLMPIVSSMSQEILQTPGNKVRDYIFRLSSDRRTTFGCTIENFIACTLESQETNPHYVMRNVRQFMTGIKNYLVKHGEGELEELIERERVKLGVNQFLNIDTIIEGALHVCVLQPVKHHIYKLFVDEHTRTGSLKLMTKNIKYARTKSPEELGIKSGLRPPKPSDMEVIKQHLDKMQRAYSPLKKLENLLNATSMIHTCVRKRQFSNRVQQSQMGADDFLPMLIYALVQSGLVSGEIEADYMWGLLHPSLLTGEGGYYLTTLSSAVLVLKNLQETRESMALVPHDKMPSISEIHGFLKIAIPDELRDSIVWKTLPIRPSMNTKEVCSLIAHKFKVTNPQDYGLFLLADGEESHLADNLCPQMIKGEYLTSTKEIVFAFKRIDANIAWPKNLKRPIAMQDKV